jgi:hypothetical protein
MSALGPPANKPTNEDLVQPHAQFPHTRAGLSNAGQGAMSVMSASHPSRTSPCRRSATRLMSALGPWVSIRLRPVADHGTVGT